MRFSITSWILLSSLGLIGCGDKDVDTGSDDVETDDTGPPADPPPMEGFDQYSCADFAEPCTQIALGDVEGLFEATNMATDGTTIILAEGTYSLDNQVTIRNASDFTLHGQGIDLTTLDFSEQTIQANGVDAVGDGFTISDLSIQDSQKDGLRIEDSDRVIIRRTRTTWSALESEENGAYGIYPVRSSNILIDSCEAHNASDAGIYVGQSQWVVVKDSLATGNVAGIEIENTQYADVYNNTALNNTGGMLIFDLPGNPVFSRDIKVHGNTIQENNTPNFAPGGTVSQIPAGTGAVILAARRVEFTGNFFVTNNSTDIAILNGLAIESDEDAWAIAHEDIIGDWEDLLVDNDGTHAFNHRSSDILIADNNHSGSGMDVDENSLTRRPIGFLIGAIYNPGKVDDILYDSIGETSFDPVDAALNSNDNRVCLGNNADATFASLDLETQAARLEVFDFPTVDDLFRPASPFAPFDCTELASGPIGDITISVE
ncbi:MAG: parallel beta-helix domain-containing protein [Myxococcota bacterium]